MTAMRPSYMLVLGIAARIIANDDHGGAQKPKVEEGATWMVKHMAEEHHAADFDAESFFALHDYDSDGHWEPGEILRTYGLMDESNKDVSQERKQEIVHEILKLADADADGFVSRDEFHAFIQRGKTLPDLGTGPGHHGDDEYEYEIHHWEKYHDENTKLEDLTHPEDIEHFKKHEQMEEEQERQKMMDQQMIVEENIPAKFRRP